MYAVGYPADELLKKITDDKKIIDKEKSMGINNLKCPADSKLNEIKGKDWCCEKIRSRDGLKDRPCRKKYGCEDGLCLHYLRLVLLPNNVKDVHNDEVCFNVRYKVPKEQIGDYKDSHNGYVRWEELGLERLVEIGIIPKGDLIMKKRPEKYGGDPWKN